MTTTLFVQMAALNERDAIAAVIEAVPRHIPGIDRVSVLVIDDGSTDGTADVARAAGADVVVRHETNLGLGTAFQRGLDECLARGADIIVHTDADGHYASDEIPRLIEPILMKRVGVGIVIGQRRIRDLRHYTPAMRLAHMLGSGVMSAVCGQPVRDPVCGFRAFSAHAAARIRVTHSFSHTIETIAQVPWLDVRVSNVPISAHTVSRPSRLLRKGGLNFIFRQAEILLDVLMPSGAPLQRVQMAQER